MKNFISELEGRIDFYERLGYQGNPNEENCNIDYSTNTDGVINGVLFEHKPVINNNISPLNKVLGQAIKYLSKKRVNAIDVPDTILLISQNDEIAYHFRSENYIKEIHQFYTTSASNDNDLSLDVSKFEQINYGKDGFDRIHEIISTSGYIKVDVDINNVISLARRYYKENRTSQKGDFLNEIRNPEHFKYINPYTKEIDDNSEFGYIMDKLNDDFLQQEIGAYYTPIEYSEKSLELLRKAINNRPKGNDYIIIDRCAGTGNLEEMMTDEEVSHCILNTYEYFEWLELRRQYADRALYVVPKTDSSFVRGEGVIKEGDALSESFLKDETLQKYIKNPKNTIIVFENPPYFSGSSNMGALVVNAASGEGGKKRSTRTQERSWVYERMKENNISGSAAANVVRQFIWSSYSDYLRQNGDSLIVYSPVSYFKGYHIQEYMPHLKFDTGFGFNRKFFAPSKGLISCIKWDYDSSFDSIKNEEKSLEIELYNINSNRQVEKEINCETLSIKKIYSSPNYYFNNKDTKNAFACLSNNGALPKSGLGCLYSIAKKTGRNDETYLNEDNYYEMLPVYVAQLAFDKRKWYFDDNTLRTADMENKYLECKQLLKRSLIFACLYSNNHCHTQLDSDGNLILNQLCLDTNTVASKKLKELEPELDDADKKLLKRWEKILELAKMTPEYKANYKYGIHQISAELDTYDEVNMGLNVVKKYRHPELHNHLKELQKETMAYYMELIEPLLFEYELIK